MRALQKFSTMVPVGGTDLAELAHHKLGIWLRARKLKELAAMAGLSRMPRSPANWEAKVYSRKQIEYCAYEIIFPLIIYQQLQSRWNEKHPESP